MEEDKIIPRRIPANDAIEIVPPGQLHPWEQPEREPHIRDYWRIVRKHQWLILTFLLTVVTVVTIATFKMKPVYEASARIEVDQETSNILPFQNTDPYGAYEDLDTYIETQAKVLLSETLALETIKSLGLASNPEFGGTPGGSVSVPSIDSSQAPISRPAILGNFIGSLSVKRVPNSRLLEITFSSTDPNLAARVLNAHLQTFIDYNFRSRYEATTQASKWLEQQLDDYRIRVEKSEDARLAYERANHIWEIDEKQDITSQKLGDLNKELTDAQADRMRKEADYRLASAGDIDSVPAVRDNQLVQDLVRKQTDLHQQLNDALSQYGPNFPKVQRLQEQVKSMDQFVASQKQDVVKRLEQDYRTAVRREEMITASLDLQKNATNQMGEKMVQYNILKRDADANKQLYDGLLEKLKEASISAGLHSSNIRVVDAAMQPSSPARPIPSRNILLAIVVGLVGGIGLAFVREYMDNTVKTPDDVEMLSHLPSLAVVPAFTALEGKRGRLSRLLKSSSNGHEDLRVELASFSMPQSQMSEAFRSLRTSLLLSQAGHPPQVILVTSALPREGKTTAAVNLAVTLAQLGDNTLLVDADLRKPGVSRTMGMSDNKYAGLSSHLAGVSALDSVIVPHPVIENLSILPTGPVPPNPADLLSSERLRQAIVELRRFYKFIVIDSPPIMAATDAVILSVLADGVLIVVRSGETPKDAFTRTRDLLGGVRSRLLGVLLNAVDSNAPDYYYSYRYYPYSYRGYSHDATKPEEPASKV
jgi:capsular exopolysaccharide synthesis family protein